MKILDRRIFCACNIVGFVKLFFELERCVTRPSKTSHEVVLNDGTCFYHRCDRLRCTVESDSTFLATEVRKSFTKQTMLDGITSAETCFAAPFHTYFSSVSTRVTTI